MPVKRIDDLLVALALAACAALCLGFRYLPMVDLPQHYAMVSILVHHDEPTWGFAQRYTTDFLHRPYATVYWLGEALARVMSLGSAMGIVVAVCTVAPFAGAHALLAATRRPRVWLLPAIPFAFGSLWHWGFLNFLLGTGMFLAGLALVVVAARRRSRAAVVALGMLGMVLFLTHFHGLVMLLMFAPLFAWAWKKEGGPAPYVRALALLAPSAMAAAAFVLLSWAQAEGKWARMNPGIEERIERFPEFLAAGVADPWPGVWLGLFATLAAIGLALGGTRPRVEDGNAALVGAGEVDLVGPDAEAPDREQPLARREHGVGDASLAADAEDVHVREALDELRLTERPACRLEVKPLAEEERVRARVDVLEEEDLDLVLGERGERVACHAASHSRLQARGSRL